MLSFIDVIHNVGVRYMLPCGVLMDESCLVQPRSHQGGMAT